MAQGTEGLRSKQGQAFQRQRLQGPHPARGQGRREGELAPGPGARLTGGGWTPTPICGSGCPQLERWGRLESREWERRNLHLYFAPR